MTQKSAFYKKIRADYEDFLDEQAHRFPAEDLLRIDLHCHDHNSDVPDELWGRLLSLPETWLETKDLVATLERNGTDLVTITNHNNARSCWQLLAMGMDVLVGAEFTCHFPDSSLSIHVLTYGFTQQQEHELNQHRHNIYDFCRYTYRHNLPTVLPHPLFFYSHNAQPDISLLEKFAVLFTRFEVLNGQRGYWQNLLTRYWIDSLTPENIDKYAAKHGLDPFEFNADPYKKSVTGGSDDHNGIFAGRTGTLAYIPNLQERLRQHKRSELVLEAIRLGNTAPFGEVGEEEKLTTTFLDYFSQVAMHMQDPGLLRLLLHRGSLKDKMACLAISNAMQELKRHQYTLTFLRTFHEALRGKKPALLTSLGVTKEFKPTLKVVKEIAKTQRNEPEKFLSVIRKGVPEIYDIVTRLFFKRLNQHTAQLESSNLSILTTDDLLRRFEVSTHFRSLFSGDKSAISKDITPLDLSKLFDQLTFPALASCVITGASFAASQVIYSNRPFLNTLAKTLGQAEHPQKVLWLTDTFDDHNGVSSVLKSTLKEIQKHDYPIDMLTCHPTLEPEPHLLVVKPISQFSLQSLGEQEFNVPNLLEVQRIFERGGYDRIICSTEMVMGLVALYLKKAFNVSTFFFMHTDWMEFVKRTTALSAHETDRFRRILRAFYLQFDGIFTLNSDHKRWLQSADIGVNSAKVFSTHHWIDAPQPPCVIRAFKPNQPPILLYVGRISEEKGVFELPDILARIRMRYPEAQLWIAGSGPAQKQLSIVLPDATFFGWVDREALSKLYMDADLLILPSRFDTFGYVVLEAMSHGMPVIAYNCKGPKDIIQHNISGYLVDNYDEIAESVIDYQEKSPAEQKTMHQSAIKRCLDYEPNRIMQQLMQDMGLQWKEDTTNE